MGSNCAPNKSKSSQPGIGICVAMAASMERPVTAISWISAI